MSKKVSVTQKEIAKTAGVSQTVVSFVLNNSYGVTISEDTRQRVLEIANELGYVPQVAAQNLVRGHSSNIGLVLIYPHYQVLRDPFIPNVMTGIGRVSRSQGYRLLVEHINRMEDIGKIRSLLKGKEIAGLVISNFQAAADVIRPLFEEGYPIVLLQRDSSGFADINSVSIDHLGGVRKLTEHLLNLGHRTIACIGYTTAGDAQVARRFGMFRQVVEAAGSKVEARYVRYGSFDPESGYDAMKSLLEERPLPTAVYGMNDLMALGAIRAIHEAGLRIPDDIAVVGYDDMRFSAFTYPPLTTVHAPEVELGQEAGKMVVSMIDGSKIENSHVSLETELVIRASCGATSS
jgi:DNA-binding LacI/PurR family transcriptional regulator